MADDNTLKFGFDTSFFNKGVNSAMGKLGELESTSSKIATGMVKGFTKIIGKLGLVAGAVKLVKSAINSMPEIGQVMGISKDIFMKNLLYPLRKELFPLLQKLLNWVRDSRVRFVKWGESIVNVFKVVVEIATKVVNLVKKISSGIASFIENTFGISLGKIEDLFNIITFKIAVVVEFAQVIIKRLLGYVTDVTTGLKDMFTLEPGNLSRTFDNLVTALKTIFEFAKKIGQEFAGGFLSSVRGISEPINRIFNGIIHLLGTMYESITKIFGDTDRVEKWGNVFRKIGEVYGTVVLTVVEAIADAIEGIDRALTNINEKGFGDWLKDTGTGVLEGIGDWWSNRKERRVQDAIIRPNGEVIETSPQDTLVALKSADVSMDNLSKSNIIHANFDFSGIQIVVPEGSTPEYGKEIGMNLVDTIRDEWNREQERYGII